MSTRKKLPSCFYFYILHAVTVMKDDSQSTRCVPIVIKFIMEIAMLSEYVPLLLFWT